MKDALEGMVERDNITMRCYETGHGKDKSRLLRIEQDDGKVTMWTGEGPEYRSWVIPSRYLSLTLRRRVD